MLETERDKQKEKIQKLEENIEKLEERNKSLAESVDNLQQYSRRNCLLLHRVKETKDKNTDDVTIKTLSEEISHEDLDRTHRIGKTDRNDGKSRPIIIKFARYAARNNV